VAVVTPPEVEDFVTEPSTLVPLTAHLLRTELLQRSSLSVPVKPELSESESV
jgi:hypothetical protein